MCLYSRLIQNRKYTPTKKNGGKVPPLPLIMVNGKMIPDERVRWVAVGCQKCIECMKKKSREWSVRLQEEIRHNKNGLFVALTFSDESIAKIGKEIKTLKGYDRDNEIARIATRRFLERWRKKYKKSTRHWLITELGHQGTNNIHMHGIIWSETLDKETLRNEIENIWQYGYIYPRKQEIQKNSISEKTINYMTKYVTKVDADHKEYQPKIFCSQGIGAQYLNRVESSNNKYIEGKTNEVYKTRQLAKLGLPIYYRNKIYTEEQREKLWQEKLDKGTRWILGQKVANEKDYYKALKFAQEKNATLGYGTSERNWNRKRYEDSQRNLKFKQRLWKAKRTDGIKADHMKKEKEERKIKINKYQKLKNKMKFKDIIWDGEDQQEIPF